MQRKRLIRSSSVLAVALAALSFSVAGAAEYFPRDLAQGDQGLDVFNLQVALNADSRTQVAQSGAGSPGQETDFFGAKTAAALVGYQKIKGISPAGGAADARTREALGSTLASLVGTSAAPAGASSAAAASLGASPAGSSPLETLRAFLAGKTPRTSPVEISSAPGVKNFQTGRMVFFGGLSQTGEVGKVVRLTGTGFDAGADYQIINVATDKKFADGVATSTASIEFTVPKRAKPGEYTLIARGEKGDSNEVKLVVSGRNHPTVAKVEPAVITPGAKVTVTGTGLTADSRIMTSFGEVESVALGRRGGSTLTFTSALGADFPKLPFAPRATSTYPGLLYVVNAKGASDKILINVAF